MIDKVLSLLYPHKCTFCNKPIKFDNDKYICDNCEKSLPYLEKGGCVKCGCPTGEFALDVCSNCRKYNHSFEKSFTPLVYTGNVRRAILRMKFYNAEYSARAFSFLIADRILSSDAPLFDFITYVPVSGERFVERGFDQAKIIADELSKIMNIPVVDSIVHRDVSCRQSSLPQYKRRKNAKESFKGKDVKLSGTALLVDDIYTTGATMDACSKLLLKMGCDKVYIASVAINLK
jgi:ComF family protein